MTHARKLSWAFTPALSRSEEAALARAAKLQGLVLPSPPPAANFALEAGLDLAPRAGFDAGGLVWLLGQLSTCSSASCWASGSPALSGTTSLRVWAETAGALSGVLLFPFVALFSLAWQAPWLQAAQRLWRGPRQTIRQLCPADLRGVFGLTGWQQVLSTVEF